MFKLEHMTSVWKEEGDFYETAKLVLETDKGSLCKFSICAMNVKPSPPNARGDRYSSELSSFRNVGASINLIKYSLLHCHIY